MQNQSIESLPVMARHWKLSVRDYRRMAKAGILREDDRVELIEGELIAMTPIGAPHAGLANRINKLFAPRLIERATLCIQNPIHLGKHSEPQPDFALLRYRADDYIGALPVAEDVLLLVEIADSSGRYDRKIKIPLYARHGIAEYWIVDLKKRCIEVHLDPDREHQRYREIRSVEQGGLAPACFPDVVVDVAEFLRF